MIEQVEKVRDDSSLLPSWFVPSDKDVVCGWARQNHGHPGNERFRNLVSRSAPLYEAATSKIEKTQVIATLVAKIREDSPEGGFVKQDAKTKRWFEIGDDKARDKVGHAIRREIMEAKKRKGSKARQEEMRKKKKGITTNNCLSEEERGNLKRFETRAFPSFLSVREGHSLSRSNISNCGRVPMGSTCSNPSFSDGVVPCGPSDRQPQTVLSLQQGFTMPNTKALQPPPLIWNQSTLPQLATSCALGNWKHLQSRHVESPVQSSAPEQVGSLSHVISPSSSLHLTNFGEMNFNETAISDPLLDIPVCTDLGDYNTIEVVSEDLFDDMLPLKLPVF